MGLSQMVRFVFLFELLDISCFLTLDICFCRMVVLFEDCCRKVELHLRYLKLQRVLMEKIFELRSLESQEQRVMRGGTEKCFATSE